MRVKVLVDDVVTEGRTPVHGFATLLEVPDHTLLFDTGPDGGLLLEALEAEGLDLSDLDMVVVSHGHKDHAGALSRLLYERARLPVSAPLRSTSGIGKGLPRNTFITGEDGPRRLAPHVITTGDLGGEIPEQALMLSTDEGTVVLTGCCHPGLTRLMEAVDGEAAIVMGGIHDLSADDLPLRGVGRIIACHCTPRKRIITRTEDNVELGGVGTTLELAEPTEPTPPE
jgi:7,8-dihydropterin-6-yl-methyl-4-(beta-D-ribofuranosyl)aminobenzene 5'-phosphate synthase